MLGRAGVRLDFEAGVEKGTGRGGKGKDGRAGLVCSCFVRLGGPQPLPFPLCASER